MFGIILYIIYIKTLECHGVHCKIIKRGCYSMLIFFSVLHYSMVQSLGGKQSIQFSEEYNFKLAT